MAQKTVTGWTPFQCPMTFQTDFDFVSWSLKKQQYLLSCEEKRQSCGKHLVTEPLTFSMSHQHWTHFQATLTFWNEKQTNSNCNKLGIYNFVVIWISLNISTLFLCGIFFCRANTPSHRFDLELFDIFENWTFLFSFLQAHTFTHLAWKRRSQSTVSREGFGIWWMSRHEAELDTAVSKMLLYCPRLQ